MAVLWNTNHVLVKFFKMKAYDITKLTVELKSDNFQYRNNIIYITVAALFCWRRSIAI